jgi:hypothetical protein
VEGRLVKKCREESKNIELLKMFSRFVRPQAVSALHNNTKNFSTSTQVVIFARSMLKINVRFCWVLLMMHLNLDGVHRLIWLEDLEHCEVRIVFVQK